MEIRKVATVVGYKAWHAGLLADAVDAYAVFVACGQRLLYVAWLACPHAHDGKCGMRRRGRGDVNGVDIGIVNQLLGIGVPLGYVVPLSVGTGLVLASAHHCLYMRPFYFVEGGT